MNSYGHLGQIFSDGPVLTDGAWGTELAAAGLPPGAIPDLWNLSNPDKVETVARTYVDAGSDVILTNTFRANRIALAHCDPLPDIAALNAAGVRISRIAAGSQVAVFASMGPSGKMLMTGDITTDQLEAAFIEQATALASAGADAIVVETMSDIDEATLAVRAAKRTRLPVVASMVFDSGRDKTRTMMGTTPEDAVRELEAAGADVVGANCGVGVEHYREVCRRMTGATTLPVWIKANAGLPTYEGSRVSYATTPDEFATTAMAIVAAGAHFIGGCCGTTPEFIRAMRRRLTSPQGGTVGL